MTSRIKVTFEEPYRRTPVWPELQAKAREGKVVHTMDSIIHFSGLEEGMESGRPSMMIRIDLPTGETILAETSMRSFIIASKMLIEKFGDQIE